MALPETLKQNVNDRKQKTHKLEKYQAYLVNTKCIYSIYQMMHAFGDRRGQVFSSITMIYMGGIMKMLFKLLHNLSFHEHHMIKKRSTHVIVNTYRTGAIG